MTTVEWSRVPCPYLATPRRFAAVAWLPAGVDRDLGCQPRRRLARCAAAGGRRPAGRADAAGRRRQPDRPRGPDETRRCRPPATRAWVEIGLDQQDRSLLLTHSAAPSIAAGAERPWRLDRRGAGRALRHLAPAPSRAPSQAMAPRRMRRGGGDSIHPALRPRLTGARPQRSARPSRPGCAPDTSASPRRTASPRSPSAAGGAPRSPSQHARIHAGRMRQAAAGWWWFAALDEDRRAGHRLARRERLGPRWTGAAAAGARRG